jgi:hypothetical protein
MANFGLHQFPAANAFLMFASIWSREISPPDAAAAPWEP